MLHNVAAPDMYHLHVFVDSGNCNVSGRTSNKTILQYNTLCCYGTSSKHAYMHESVLSLGWAIEAHMQCDEEARGAESVNERKSPACAACPGLHSPATLVGATIGWTRHGGALDPRAAPRCWTPAQTPSPAHRAAQSHASCGATGAQPLCPAGPPRACCNAWQDLRKHKKANTAREHDAVVALE